MAEITISRHNTKMGNVASISFPPIVTCIEDAPCAKACYARRLSARYRTVRESYERNFNAWMNNPMAFWTYLDFEMQGIRFFRFFVSGDMPSFDFCKEMLGFIERNTQTEFFMFTKRYVFINDYIIATNHPLPKNFHVIFSAWKGLKMDNPFNLPTCHVLYKDGSCTAKNIETAYKCSGNCFECATTCSGCWGLHNGEEVVINKH